MKAWLFVALEYCGHATPVVEKCLHETNPFVKVTSFFCITVCVLLFGMVFKIADSKNSESIFMFEPVFYMKTLFFLQ